jgi:hypothetical protein
MTTISDVTALTAAVLSLAPEVAVMVERVDSELNVNEVFFNARGLGWDVRIVAIGPAIAASRVARMLVTSAWRFSIERSVSGAAVGAEMTLVKMLARARIRVNFMFAKVL